MGRPTGVGQQNPCLRLCHGPDVFKRTFSLASTSMPLLQMPSQSGEVAMASGPGQWHCLGVCPPPVMSQEALVLAFCKLFPAS